MEVPREVAFDGDPPVGEGTHDDAAFVVVLAFGGDGRVDADDPHVGGVVRVIGVDMGDVAKRPEGTGDLQGVPRPFFQAEPFHLG